MAEFSKLPRKWQTALKTANWLGNGKVAKKRQSSR